MINNNYQSQTHVSAFLAGEQQLEIDTELSNLSSRKLWQILKLSHMSACSLDSTFILEVKQELLARNDFNEGIAWMDPH